MLKTALCLVLFSLGLQAQPPGFKLNIVPIEQTTEDANHTVVHFVTNRLVVGRDKNKPAWETLNPDKFFLHATDTPLAGYAVVKHDGTPDVENDANLKPFSIAEFHPQYKVRALKDDTKPPFLINEVTDDGMSWLRNLWRRDVLVYVHGFNTDFSTAVRRAAQLKRDFQKLYKRDFSVVVYSWPSLGGTAFFGLSGILEYTDDQSRYRQSIPAIAKFLDAILLKDGKTDGRGKRWGFAHSMGNRCFLKGFAEMGRQAEVAKRTLPRDLFSRIVLAAPDMEIQDFEEHANYIFQFCSTKKPVMYFHATSNVAVTASQMEHFDQRAGVTPVVSSKLLTIDAKAAKSPWSELGHGYYASNDKMVKLTADYFFGDSDPSKSTDLESVDGKRWRLK